MEAAVYRQPFTHILYDADAIERPGRQWFDPEYWAEQSELETFTEGRGGCWKVDMPNGAAVIKHYRRGGLVAKLSHDKYVFTGWQRSRSFVEWRVLAELSKRGLPVPIPLAAICVRHGRFYCAALVTRYITGARTLSDCLKHNPEQTELLAAKTSQLLALFNEGNVLHADLNLNNIVVDSNDKLWLLDFDRGRFVTMTEKRQQRSLKRLSRSLNTLVDTEKIDAELAKVFLETLHMNHNSGIG